MAQSARGHYLWARRQDLRGFPMLSSGTHLSNETQNQASIYRCRRHDLLVAAIGIPDVHRQILFYLKSKRPHGLVADWQLQAYRHVNREKARFENDTSMFHSWYAGTVTRTQTLVYIRRGMWNRQLSTFKGSTRTSSPLTTPPFAHSCNKPRKTSVWGERTEYITRLPCICTDLVQHFGARFGGGFFAYLQTVQAAALLTERRNL